MPPVPPEKAFVKRSKARKAGLVSGGRSRERLALLHYVDRGQLKRLGPGIMRIVYGAVGHNETIARLDLKGWLALDE